MSNVKRYRAKLVLDYIDEGSGPPQVEAYLDQTVVTSQDHDAKVAALEDKIADLKAQGEVVGQKTQLTLADLDAYASALEVTRDAFECEIGKLPWVKVNAGKCGAAFGPLECIDCGKELDHLWCHECQQGIYIECPTCGHQACNKHSKGVYFCGYCHGEFSVNLPDTILAVVTTAGDPVHDAVVRKEANRETSAVGFPLQCSFCGGADSFIVVGPRVCICVDCAKTAAEAPGGPEPSVARSVPERDLEDIQRMSDQQASGDKLADAIMVAQREIYYYNEDTTPCDDCATRIEYEGLHSTVARLEREFVSQTKTADYWFELANEDDHDCELRQAAEAYADALDRKQQRYDELLYERIYFADQYRETCKRLEDEVRLRELTQTAVPCKDDLITASNILEEHDADDVSSFLCTFIDA